MRKSAAAPAPASAAPARSARPRAGAWHKRRPTFGIAGNTMKPWQAFNIPMNLLRAAMIFGAQGDVRYYLNGVLIEPTPEGDAVFVVATDGHRMFIVRHALDVTLPAHQRRPVILEREDLKAVSKLKSDSLCFVGIEGPKSDAPTVRAQVATLIGLKKGREVVDEKVHLIRSIDGRFPDWKTVLQPNVAAFRAIKKNAELGGTVPADYQVVEANMKYLDDCRAVAALLSTNGAKGRYYNECYAMQNKESKSYLVTWPQNSQAVGIVMGLQSGMKKAAIPDWLSEMHPEPPAKADGTA